MVRSIHFYSLPAFCSVIPLLSHSCWEYVCSGSKYRICLFAPGSHSWFIIILYLTKTPWSSSFAVCTAYQETTCTACVPDLELCRVEFCPLSVTSVLQSIQLFLCIIYVLSSAMCNPAVLCFIDLFLTPATELLVEMFNEIGSKTDF